MTKYVYTLKGMFTGRTYKKGFIEATCKHNAISKLARSRTIPRDAMLSSFKEVRK